MPEPNMWIRRSSLPLVGVVRYGILIFILVIALEQSGVQAASLFAVLGAAGLAIGLVLQGTLTNYCRRRYAAVAQAIPPWRLH